MENSIKKDLVMLSIILQKYKDNFYKAISIQNKIMGEMSMLPVAHLSKKEATEALASVMTALDKKINAEILKLSYINNILLNVNNAKDLLICIKKFDVLSLDKDLLAGLEKQKNLLKSCQNKDFVSNVVLKRYEQTVSLLNNLYISSINQIDICKTFIDSYIHSYEKDFNN